MFSRKKNDLLIFSTRKERRTSFRVKVSPEEPASLTIGNNHYRITDISALGVGVYRAAGEALEAGEKYPFTLSLPLIGGEISGIVQIIDVSEKAYHCAFIDLGKDEIEKIHLFVLERQKEELRECKKT